jgi:hypothetical protein
MELALAHTANVVTASTSKLLEYVQWAIVASDNKMAKLPPQATAMPIISV